MSREKATSDLCPSSSWLTLQKLTSSPWIDCGFVFFFLTISTVIIGKKNQMKETKLLNFLGLRLPRAVVDSLSLEGSKRCLDEVLRYMV